MGARRAYEEDDYHDAEKQQQWYRRREKKVVSASSGPPTGVCGAGVHEDLGAVGRDSFLKGDAWRMRGAEGNGGRGESVEGAAGKPAWLPYCPAVLQRERECGWIPSVWRERESRFFHGQSGSGRFSL